jgi:hypothetical protein
MLTTFSKVPPPWLIETIGYYSQGAVRIVENKAAFRLDNVCLLTGFVTPPLPPFPSQYFSPCPLSVCPFPLKVNVPLLLEVPI